MIKLATVFSGIGAIEQALIQSKEKFEIVFACDNGEITLPQKYDEIKKDIENKSIVNTQDYIKMLYKRTKKQNWMKISYFANYNIKERNWFDDIRFIDGKQFKGKVDLFVGGSPCQSFSNMGKRGGLEDTRGTLFYDYARLVKEMEPKVFIYENVPGMLNHDGGKTWETIKKVFSSLGYKINYKLLNSSDFGIPQKRIRLYVVGFKDKTVNFEFPKEKKLTKTMFDFLEEVVEPKYYLRQKGFKFVTTNISRARVNEDIIRTQKANQQFNWNGNFVFENVPGKHTDAILQRAYVGTFKGEKGIARQLTPRECLRLMGFSDSFKIVVPNVHAYRQSGNSIVVNVLLAIMKEIVKTGVFANEQA